MEITTLRTILEDCRDTEVKSVVFDSADFLNQEYDKPYPLIFWDIDNSRWTKHRRKEEETLTLNVYCLATGDETTENKFETWAKLERILDQYLQALEEDQVTVTNPTIEKEYYPAGMLSIDNEYAIRYNLTLKLWC